MEQVLLHRDVRYVVGSAHGDARNWVIFPKDGPADGAASGVARLQGTRGSFKAAVMEARAAIDAWLDRTRN